jgi:hypothetical protein
MITRADVVFGLLSYTLSAGKRLVEIMPGIISRGKGAAGHTGTIEARIKQPRRAGNRSSPVSRAQYMIAKYRIADCIPEFRLILS